MIKALQIALFPTYLHRHNIKVLRSGHFQQPAESIQQANLKGKLGPAYTWAISYIFLWRGIKGVGLKF